MYYYDVCGGVHMSDVLYIIRIHHTFMTEFVEAFFCKWGATHKKIIYITYFKSEVLGEKTVAQFVRIL